MQRHVVVWLVIALARTAAAQAPGQIEPVAAPFLEKRVPEELATEGVVLSRRNLALQIEQLGDKWLVSLVNLTTGRNLGPCHDPAVVGPLIAIGIGTIGLGVGVWYQFHPHPIDENAAKSLADAYNQGLRRQLGLPVASRRPLLRGVRLAPYVAAHQGGLGLSARF
jgi:hypothetical protein